MKLESNIVPAERYYYEKHRHHSLRFMFAATLLSNAIVWGLVAAFYAMPTVVIWLSIAAVFFIFMTVIEYRACDHYHTRHLRATRDSSLINTNTTNQ